jgi:hypothetical protein
MRFVSLPGTGFTSIFAIGGNCDSGADKIGCSFLISAIGWRMGGTGSLPGSVFLLAITCLYAGQCGAGLDIAYQCVDKLVNQLGIASDMPNIIRADLGNGQVAESTRVYGADYYQMRSVWALPGFAALNIHTHGGQHALIPQVHALDVDDQQLDIVEAPFQQLLERGFGSFDAFPG